jgi:ribosomal protein S18 acetylase RimI-like enzyme
VTVLDSITSTEQTPPSQIAVPCSTYDYKTLAEIYNQGRIDYIVPMPMNARRLEEYVRAYDVNLEASLVAVDTNDNLPNGLGMLSVRGDRSWITRLGVDPERRRRKTGEFLMRHLLDQAQKHQAPRLQLEVIQDNVPAYQLFRKFGFEETRRLLIIRRPPGKLKTGLLLPPKTILTPMDEERIVECLARRPDAPSWIEESSSLINAGNLAGLDVQLDDGRTGWIVFQRSSFLLTHFVFSTLDDDDLAAVLLTAVHHENPGQDTRIENVPDTTPLLRAYFGVGYVEAFARIEMVLHV